MHKLILIFVIHEDTLLTWTVNKQRKEASIWTDGDAFLSHESVKRSFAPLEEIDLFMSTDETAAFRLTTHRVLCYCAFLWTAAPSEDRQEASFCQPRCVFCSSTKSLHTQSRSQEDEPGMSLIIL